MMVRAGRNERCPCGSGKKYKRCCGEQERAGGGAELPRPAGAQPRSEDPAPAVLNRLVAMAQNGQHAELEIRARELLEGSPRSGMLWRLLGMALWMQGKNSEHALAKVVALLPNDSEALANLGAAHLARKQPREAADLLRRALEIEPNFAVGHNNLGSALRGLGDVSQAEASYRRALQLDESFAMAHCNLGHVLLTQSRIDEAAQSYRRAIELQPDFVDALNGLANAVKEMGRLTEAVEIYQKALTLKPDNAEVLNNLGITYIQLVRVEEAGSCIRQALAIDPLHAEAHNNLAKVLRLQGRFEEARASCQRALEIDPDLVAAYSLLSHLASDRGDFSEAEDHLKSAVSIKPDMMEAWAAIPRLRRMRQQDADWLAKAEEMAARLHAPRQESDLYYAMGKYYDDVGDFERAFEMYRRANEVARLCNGGHDRQRVTKIFDRVIEIFDRRWVESIPHPVNRSSRPVFVVGMPRSGTTLAEQILSAHPAAFGAGELTFWTNVLPKYLETPPVPDSLQIVLQTIGDSYLKLLEGLSSDALRVVDKMPANFSSLGLIFGSLPDSRIIHMSRSPLDTCLSIYFQDFNITHSYANDLEDLAHFYTQYIRLMNHWRSTLPEGWILDVPYQKLTENPEEWSRKMVDFAGLPWDPKCLQFYQSDRPVLTCSKWQVRQKITKSSVARWRRYEKFIGPLMHLAELDPYP